MMSIRQIRTKVADTVVCLNPQETTINTSTIALASQDLRSQNSPILVLSPCICK